MKPRTAWAGLWLFAFGCASFTGVRPWPRVVVSTENDVDLAAAKFLAAGWDAFYLIAPNELAMELRDRVLCDDMWIVVQVFYSDVGWNHNPVMVALRRPLEIAYAGLSSDEAMAIQLALWARDVPCTWQLSHGIDVLVPKRLLQHVKSVLPHKSAGGDSGRR